MRQRTLHDLQPRHCHGAVLGLGFGGKFQLRDGAMGDVGYKGPSLTASRRSWSRTSQWTTPRDNIAAASPNNSSASVLAKLQDQQISYDDQHRDQFNTANVR